jgi:hypothetical protein
MRHPALVTAAASALALVVGSTALAVTIRGTSRADVIHGTARADTLYGRGGADRIYGLAGNDRIYPGAGKDRVYCGAGRDRVSADNLDVVARDCEVVTRPEPPPPPPPQPPAATCANGADDDADGKTDFPADPGCTDSSDVDERDPIVEVIAGSYRGQTQNGDFVFFDVLPDRTIRGFRANDMREECDGPLYVYGPVNFGQTPRPIGVDGGFAYQYDGPGTISGQPAEYHIRVAGKIRGSSASGTALFTTSFDYEGRRWNCSTGEKTWSAERLP